jgi:predicted small lipoprotein YifL
MNRKAAHTLMALVPLGLALSACGTKGELAPPPGESLPPAAYGTSQRETSEELLQLDPQAAPERRVELRERSEERTDDPFDIPPQ